VYGERQPLRGQYAPVVGIFLRQLAAGEPLTIVGDGEQRRDFTYVGDVVSANIKVAISNPDPEIYGEVFNVGSGVNYSVNELAAMISDNTVNIPPRVGESRISLANTDRMYGVFSWKPSMKLEDWLSAQL
jgi:UDP-glucose 4-epimerase